MIGPAVNQLYDDEPDINTIEDFEHELVTVITMRERKLLMETRADAFVALPGGFGRRPPRSRSLRRRAAGDMLPPRCVLGGERSGHRGNPKFEIRSTKQFLMTGIINPKKYDLEERTEKKLPWRSGNLSRHFTKI